MAKAKDQEIKAKVEKKEKKSTYGADSITVLEGLEAVRRRPGMYRWSSSFGMGNF
jgi:DNA gyrase subunit B